MYRIHVDKKQLSVTMDMRFGGGVLDSQLISHFGCPECHETLKFMALFESSDD